MSKKYELKRVLTILEKIAFNDETLEAHLKLLKKHYDTMDGEEELPPSDDGGQHPIGPPGKP